MSESGASLLSLRATVEVAVGRAVRVAAVEAVGLGVRLCSGQVLLGGVVQVVADALRHQGTTEEGLHLSEQITEAEALDGLFDAEANIDDLGAVHQGVLVLVEGHGGSADHAPGQVGPLGEEGQDPLDSALAHLAGALDLAEGGDQVAFVALRIDDELGAQHLTGVGLATLVGDHLLGDLHEDVARHRGALVVRQPGQDLDGDRAGELPRVAVQAVGEEDFRVLLAHEPGVRDIPPSVPGAVLAEEHVPRVLDDLGSHPRGLTVGEDHHSGGAGPDGPDHSNDRFGRSHLHGLHVILLCLSAK